MALKHLTRLVVPRGNGSREEVFLNDDGLEVEPLNRFRRHLQDRRNAPTTVARYMDAAARFIDFLIECGVFGRAVRPSQISDAVHAYPIFLSKGASIDWPELPGLAAYAEEVGLVHGLARNSFAPVLADVNRFLVLARDEAIRAEAAMREHGIAMDSVDLSVTFSAIDGTVALSRRERERLKQQTVLGGVIRIRHEFKRPLVLRSPIRGGQQVDLENKEFPLDRLADLLDAARSHRDRALWSLLAGGGLRLHEALNLHLGDMDPATQEVWVVDPANRRFGREMTDSQKLRFKGRTMSRVYMWEPLRTVFWEALGSYLRSEFVGTNDDDNVFLFKKIDGAGRGQPLVRASDTALEKQFKSAVRRAKVPGPREAPTHLFTPHSLRHSYGVYMLNHIPVPGGPGLKATEVQMLMGHASVESTLIYARHDRIMLEAQVEAANELVFAGSSATDLALDLMPQGIATRLRQAADRIEADQRQDAGSRQLGRPPRVQTDTLRKDRTDR
ncbi:site-specific integrase [Methylobacterium hispanicum]|uniref:tyrosine-type recombinase/integrase n=1 Tax=Methylobacterium hispanicum TaxID=270350 RepID=UPI002F304BA8